MFFSKKNVILLLLVLEYIKVIVPTGMNMKYLQFADQEKNVIKKATNFASLTSEQDSHLLKTKFTICGSIYIGFHRGHQAFYTMRKNDNESLWFLLSLGEPNIDKHIWTIFLDYFGGTAVSVGVKVRLRTHAWSHACTAVDAESGHVIVVINGIVTHDQTVEGLIYNETIVFTSNLVLGVWQEKMATSPNVNHQSEASVSNVNIFSIFKSISNMVDDTLTGQCTKGDILSWVTSTWTFTGNVQTLSSSQLCKSSYFPHLYLLAHFTHFDNCKRLCPRLQDEGRVPLTRNTTESEQLLKQFKETSYNYALNPSGEFLMWSSYIKPINRSFEDSYTGSVIQEDLWIPGQPNGGAEQPCTFWGAGDDKARLYDVPCIMVVNPKCLCEFNDTPILRLRGLCKESNIDTYYTLQQVDGHLRYMGVSNTAIVFSENKLLLESPKWKLTVNLEETQATTIAKETTYVLGKHTWIITNDSVDCGKEKDRNLKMSGCSDGQFTCNNGDCVSMEVRCDQAIDCYDKSDEENCEIISLERSYRKTAPPVSLVIKLKDRQVTPANVRVTFTLLDISAIREADNEIDIKFTAELEWLETRATYHNLKQKINQNTLDSTHVHKLWTPKLIYRNNKDNFNTRKALEEASLKIKRNGSFSRSELDVVEEIEIFKGSENPIIMIQSYTKGFKCTYNLRAFPFDTQVAITL